MAPKKSLGLQNGYLDDDEFNLNIQMLAAVPFVPITDVIRAFESLSKNFPLDAPAQAIIDYFEDTYIGRLRPGGQHYFLLQFGTCMNKPSKDFLEPTMPWKVGIIAFKPMLEDIVRTFGNS